MNAIINMSRLSEMHGDKLVEQTINTRRRWVLESSSKQSAADATKADLSETEAVETSSAWTNIQAMLRKQAAASA
jgi:hypothetical protein